MASNPQQRLRLNLTLSTPMRIALEHLARRSGLQPTTQASMLLRQALSRTIESAEVQEAIRRHNAGRTRDGWAVDRYTEHAIETTYQEHAQALVRAITGPAATATVADTQERQES